MHSQLSADSKGKAKELGSGSTPGGWSSVARASSKHNRIRMERGKAQVIINKENSSSSVNESW